MNILICGSDGQLGSDSKQIFGKIHNVMAIDLKDVDITVFSEVEQVTKDFTADVILNCAAFTNVDACETEKELAWKVNAEGPKNLAIIAEKLGALLIHISTDYVFDGEKAPPETYMEDEKTNPLSHYGKSKLAGEEAIRKTVDKYIILRTAWLYGRSGHNFLKTMMKLTLKDPQRQIKVVHDQFGSPTWSYRLARQIERLIGSAAQGTYHATSEGYCTWYELARYFLEKMEIPNSLIPCTTQEYPTPAVRPRNSILENRRLKEADLHFMTNWESDINQFVSQYKESLLREVIE